MNQPSARKAPTISAQTSTVIPAFASVPLTVKMKKLAHGPNAPTIISTALRAAHAAVARTLRYFGSTGRF